MDISIQPTGFNIDRFKKLYQPFNQASLADLPNLYSQDVVFQDPVHQLQGLPALQDYFSGFCSPDLRCEFEFINELLGQQQAFFQWRMHYSHPRLKSGQPLILQGGSLIKFAERISYHEDFYDMGAMVYQHVPVLGWLISKVNARLAGASS